MAALSTRAAEEHGFKAAVRNRASRAEGEDVLPKAVRGVPHVEHSSTGPFERKFKEAVRNRAEMPMLRPWERARNFREVELGFSEAAALREAMRCKQCKKPNCAEGCPARVDIPGFISLIAQKKYIEAARHIRKKNLLPAVCGRACQQEQQCEGSCILGGMGNPVAIGALERFAGDFADCRWSRSARDCKNENDCRHKQKKNSGHVAIIGSGPAGLAAAAMLAEKGFEVTVFDSEKEFGGIMRTCIPEFRIPKKAVDSTIASAKARGVRFEGGMRIGEKEIEKMKKNYGAVLLATGALEARALGIKGERLSGILSALDFLSAVKSGKDVLGNAKHVVVIGGGNVAMDVARCAIRKGHRVTVACRSAEREMKARRQEIVHAREEGIWFETMLAPIAFAGKTEVEAAVFTEGTKKRRIECDAVVIAIGQVPGGIYKKISTDSAGRIRVKKNSMTSVPGIFAAGDSVLGAASIIDAVVSGKKAAEGIKKFLGT